MNSWSGEYLYTPLIVGFGTSSGINSTTYNFTQTRVGNRLKVMGRFKTGTNTATEGRIYLPPVREGSTSYLTSDSELISTLQVCGIWIIDYVGAVSMYCLIEPGVSYITFSYQNATNYVFLKANGNALNSNSTYSMQFEVPISGWNI